MKRELAIRRHWVLALLTAAAGAVVYPSISCAQYQTQDSTGRLLDANNRLGSGGINDERQTTGTELSPEDIVYGNVTRGKEFRGTLSTTDRRAFRGNITRPSDTLVRDAGASVYQQDTNDRLTSQRYYGDNRGVTEPGFQHLQPGSPGSFQIARPTYRIPGDLRMDATIPNDVTLTLPSQYILPGVTLDPVEAMAYGDMIQKMQSRNRDREAAALSTDVLGRLQISEQRIREMRDEVRRTSGEELRNNPDDVTIAPETPINDAMGNRIDSALQTRAITGNLTTEQGLRQRLLTAAPAAARQNTQYAELQKRLERFRKREAMTDEEANRQFIAEWQAAQEQKKAEEALARSREIKPQQPAVVQPSPQEKPEETRAQDLSADRRGRYAARAQDMQKFEGFAPSEGELALRIASFADGVKATGLKNLLLDAEKSMQSGKFTQALDYYDAAAAVAPDNSMVLMARSVAELGAGFYTRAQVHLEQVLSADPALLMARYDLKTFYGEDRLQYIVRDLKDLAQMEPRQSRPLFLLAFIAFSTENRQRALDYLNLAEQRGGSKDFYSELKEYWGLKPKKQPQAPGKIPAAPSDVTK